MNAQEIAQPEADLCFLDSATTIYSEHGVDECFEYKHRSGRVPEGVAVGFEVMSATAPNSPVLVLRLFSDIKYSKFDHRYWDNLELENDPDRVVVDG